MRALRAVRLVVAALVMLGLADVASAQTKIYGLQVEGEIEAGGRFYAGEPKKREEAKFEEYRDLPEGALLDKLQLRFFRPDESYSAEIGGSMWGQNDQEFFLGSERLGLWKFGFEWDQTPHIFSTNARMLATQISRGVYTLPSTRPNATSISAGQGALYNGAPQLGDIGTQWGTARLFFQVTPTPDIELRAEYTRINKDGDRPMGMGFSTGGGDFIETLEPIEQTINEFRLRGSIAREWWQAQFGYTLSLFHNQLPSLTADNPLRSTNGAFTADASGATVGSSTPATGRVALPPDNTAHTFNLAGGVNLPMRTRVNANFSYSLRLQNDNFLPHTINPNIPTTRPTALLALPQPDLGGVIGALLFNLQLISRPIRPLTLSAKYRVYDLDDMTKEHVLPGNVESDYALRPDDRTAGRWSYARHNLDLDGRWRFMQPVAVSVGGGWERWNRGAHRELRTSDELFAKAAMDLTPFEWLLARLTYKPSFRRIGDYNSHAHLEHMESAEDVDDAAVAASQNPLLRKFDEAQRDRQKVDLLLQLTPFESLMTTLTGSWRYDDYFASTLGLQQETGWSAGVDIGWTPHERVAFSGGYVYESTDQRMRSRYRPITGTTTFDFVDFEWVSAMIDTVNTINLGMNATLVPKLLDLVFNGSYSTATGQVKTQNPLAVTSGTASQRTSATARPWPDFEESLVRLESVLKYHFMQNWTASAGYVFEQFRKDDFRTDELTPYNSLPSAINSIYLGNDLKNYAAHIVALKLGYQLR